MKSRESGFTLIEIMIVMAIIAALAAGVVIIIPIAQDASKKSTCQNNLRNLGGILVMKATDKRWPRESGAAFLLQLYLTESQVKKDLVVFTCPGDEDLAYEGGSEKHVELFRQLSRKKLEDGTWDENMTSFAGRNQRDNKLKREADEKQAIACDRNGVDQMTLHHNDGINVLFEDGSVKFMNRDALGLDSEEDIPVGAGGPKPLDDLAFRVF